MNDYSSPSDAAAAGIFGAVFLIPFLILSVVMIISFWKIFDKAGKPGWAAIIPIYNIIVLLEIVGKPTWWVVLFLIPCVNYIFGIWTLNLLSKSFGQSEGFTVGMVLLGVVFFPILAFGNYQYLGPSAAEARGQGPWNPPGQFPPRNYQDPFNPPNNTPPQV